MLVRVQGAGLGYRSTGRRVCTSARQGVSFDSNCSICIRICIQARLDPNALGFGFGLGLEFGLGARIRLRVRQAYLGLEAWKLLIMPISGHALFTPNYYWVPSRRRARTRVPGVVAMAMSRSVLLAGPAILLMLYLMTRDVPPPTLSVEVAPAHGTEAAARGTSLSVLRKAAATYFPDMFTDAKYALPSQFEQTWANPCWTWEVDAGQGGTKGAGKQGVHCLPSFLILGVYQSGVRDLYSRLARHPGIAPRPATSPSFYSQVVTA